MSTNEFGGKWTEEKLLILEKYLGSYTTVLKKQNFILWYVDAFAGTGYVTRKSGGMQDLGFHFVEDWDDEMSDVLVGSTRRALGVSDKPFDKFLFVELNDGHADELERLTVEFPDRNIRVVRGDANVVLHKWCSDQGRRSVPWKGERAVVFLDPFGTQVKWSTVESLAKTESVDLWILFPVSALTRMLPVSGEPPESLLQPLDQVFGGSHWRPELYKGSVQMGFDLFDDGVEKKVRASQDRIVDLYMRQLKGVFPFVCSNPRFLLGPTESPLYVLMFAASNPGKGGEIAMKIADHLLKKW